MKLMEAWKARKQRKFMEKTIAYFMDKADATVHIEKGMMTIYCVVDTKNGYKTVADGFTTKKAAKDFCGNNYNYYINMYEKKI